MNDTLLEINDLHVSFHTVRGVIRAVRGINIDIRQGETVALVGESGCGKSVTAHAITGLLPTPPARIERGQIHFDGRDLLQIPAKEHRALRGVRISMIFQVHPARPRARPRAQPAGTRPALGDQDQVQVDDRDGDGES
jgi:ABC-type dipeptide/oligopeptide/nickel transport system ATPase component